MMLAKLGDVVFSAKEIPFHQLRRSLKAKWSEQPLLNGKYLIDKRGTEALRIEISGTLFPHLHSGLSQIDRLFAMTREDKDVAFSANIEDEGTYLGLWKVISLTEERSLFNGDGLPQKIDFSIEMVEVPRGNN